MKTIIVSLLACIAMLAQSPDYATSNHHLRIIPSTDQSKIGQLDFEGKHHDYVVSLAAPDTLTKTTIFRLPAQDGAAGSCLSTDGSANLSFSGCAGANVANGLPISAANPIFLYAHFRDDAQNTLRIDYSRDGINWTTMAKGGVFSGNSVRDPSVTVLGGQYCFIATGAAGAQDQYMCSADLIHFPATTSVLDLASYVSGATAAWAPEWFRDPVSGNTYFWVSISKASNPFSNDPNTFAPYLVQFDPTTGTVGTVTAITVNGTTQGRTFDFFPYYDGATYYVVYVDQQPGTAVAQPWTYATSPSLTGPYTQQTAPGSDYFGWGNSFQTEAPIVFPLPNGCVELVTDEWVNPAWGGRKYHPYYQTSCPAAGSPLFSASSLSGNPQPLNITRAEHGTIISVSNLGQASLAYTAAAQQQNDNYSDGALGVNTRHPLYPFEVTTNLAPSGGIMYPEPAAIGLNPGPDYCSPYGTSECAAITVCSTYPQGCWPGWPGKGRLFEYSNNDGGFGMFQFIQSQADTAEASIMFCDGCYQPGQVPLSSSASGNKAIWTMGVNNQAIDLGSNNQRFFIFNKGIVDGGGVIGGFPFELDPTTGEARINWWITLGGKGLTAYGHDRYADIWSSGQNVIEMGNGTGPFANHYANVKMGSLLVDYPAANVNAVINGNCGSATCYQRNLWFETAGTLRWSQSVRNGETGSNSGSDLYFDRLSDTGAYLDSPLWISRATGNVAVTHIFPSDGVSGSISVSCNTAIVAGTSVCTSVNITANNFTSGIRTN